MRTARTRQASGSARAALICAGALLGLALLAAPATAREGDSRAGLFLGTTTNNVDAYTTFGSIFGFSYGYEFANDLLWTAGAAFTSTAATATVDVNGTPTEVDLEARTYAARTGLLAFFAHSRAGLGIPFVGAGLSVMAYDLNYPNTTVGKTSGTAPGSYATVGVELRMTEHITLIPEFGIQVHTIKTQTGASKGFLSGGLVFTLRIST